MQMENVLFFLLALSNTMYMYCIIAYHSSGEYTPLKLSVCMEYNNNHRWMIGWTRITDNILCFFDQPYTVTLNSDQNLWLNRKKKDEYKPLYVCAIIRNSISPIG